jgi:hypothetical protein
LHRARYKLLGDATGPNLGPLTEAEKGDTRTLEEIQSQDCGRRPGMTGVKKPDATSKYRGVSWCVKLRQGPIVRLTSLQD